MKKNHIIFSVIIVLILTGYYWHLVCVGTIRETIDLQKTNCSDNIVSFSHSTVCEDCINLRYTVGNKTYSDPDANGTHFSIKFVRKTDDDIDRMINSKNDGYFMGDDLEDMGLMYRIKGVVYKNTCYYRSEKITFMKFFYGTTYYQEGERIVIDHYPSLWRYIMTWIVILFMLAALIWGEPE